ncbi:putative membrane protein [Exiguobacterium sp. S17]|nr:putative membrane protein [Exiguobacterium sp. S17]
MGPKVWSLIGLVILLATNMVLFQYTIESYMVYDHASMRLFMSIAIVNVGLIILLYRYWKKVEYSDKK